MTIRRSPFVLAITGLAMIIAACSGGDDGGGEIQDFELGTPSQSSIGFGEMVTALDAATGDVMATWTLPIGTRPEEMVTIGDTLLFPYTENASGTGVVALEGGVTPLWQYEVPGYGFGAVRQLGDDVVLAAIAYEDAYEGEQRPLGKSWLARLDARTGDSVWDLELGTLFGLAVHNDRVLIGIDGEVRALDGATGDQVWSTDFGFEIAPSEVNGRIVAVGTDADRTTHYIELDEDGTVVSDLALDRYLGEPIGIEGSTLLVTSWNRMHAYDIDAGEELWTTRGWPIPAAGPGTVLLNGNRLKAVDPISGTRLWRTPPTGERLGSASAAGDSAFAVHATGEDEWQLAAFSTGPDSAVVWRAPISGARPSTAANDDMVTVASGGTVTAFDPASGEQIWSAETDGASRGIWLHGGTVLVFATIPPTPE